ncbi:hypothetical protein NMY22_g13036 [Coprinellus aureogranulatus]|nr:hypothetical protein NMY22_g13036 [Coprinellus aureogranulatus]
MANYGDPYSNNRYQDYNTPYYSNQDYDTTGPAYDPYRPGHNVHFQDDATKEEERPPTPPSKFEDGDATTPSRQRSTRTVAGSKSLKKNDSLRVSVAPVRKHWNGFEHGEFTPVTRKGWSWPGVWVTALTPFPAYAPPPSDLFVNRCTASPTAALAYGLLVDDHHYNPTPWAYYGSLSYTLTTTTAFWRCDGFTHAWLSENTAIAIRIVLSLALWIRPPAVTIGDVITHNTTGSLSGADGLTINLSVNISVNNPNYFTVDFSRIKAEIFYPINDVPMGGGEAENIEIKSRELTEFTFPFALRYRSSDDPENKVFVDLGSKCGIGGGPRSDITVKYKITVGIRFLVVVVSPVIQNTFRFACPSGLSVGGLISGS